MPGTVIEIRCSRCKKTLPLTEFTKSSSRKNGRCSWCKSCKRAKREQYARRPRTLGTETEQKCNVCHKTLPLSAFTNLAARFNGKHPWCKPCKKAKAKLYARKPASQDQARDWRLRTHHKITLTEYNKLYDQQSGMCMLCGKVGQRSGLQHGLHVDHDHRTGKIRGLLCNSCNRGLGLIGENVTVLQRAIQYLEFHNAR